MKDNIITLNNDIKCYVIDELTYKNKKYIFSLEIDENEEMIENAVHVFEVAIKDNKLITKNIEDFEISSIVNNLFIARQMENKNS